MNMTGIKEHIIDWLSKYAQSSGANGFTIGVSGGIDSGVVSTLLAHTGLPVLILEMPIHQSAAEVTRAEKHIAWLKQNFTNVTSKEVNLTNTYDTLHKVFKAQSQDISKEDFEFSMSNTRSRLRMSTLYQFAGMHRYLVAGTGNKVEDFGIGFYTKYGDGGVDLSPIADLMKSEVYLLGHELGLIEEILNAVPTDGLHADGRTDEDQIGATYDELEWAMNYKDNHALTERQSKVLTIYRKYNTSNKHKMEPIPVCYIPEIFYLTK